MRCRTTTSSTSTCKLQAPAGGVVATMGGLKAPLDGVASTARAAGRRGRGERWRRSAAASSPIWRLSARNGHSRCAAPRGPGLYLQGPGRAADRAAARRGDRHDAQRAPRGHADDAEIGRAGGGCRRRARSRQQPLRQFRGRCAAAHPRRDRAQPARARRRARAWCSTARSRRRRSTTRCARRALGFGETGVEDFYAEGLGAGERRPHPGADQGARAARSSGSTRRSAGSPTNVDDRRRSRHLRCRPSCRTICGSGPTTSMPPRSSPPNMADRALHRRAQGAGQQLPGRQHRHRQPDDRREAGDRRRRRLRHQGPRGRADAADLQRRRCAPSWAATRWCARDVGYDPRGHRHLLATCG